MIKTKVIQSEIIKGFGLKTVDSIPELEDFLRSIGKENIIQISCATYGGYLTFFIVVYEDGQPS